VLIAQTAIHIAFLLSAMAIAYTDKLMSGRGIATEFGQITEACGSIA
jgi:uncharacterized membrane protein YqhA